MIINLPESFHGAIGRNFLDAFLVFLLLYSKRLVGLRVCVHALTA